MLEMQDDTPPPLPQGLAKSVQGPQSLGRSRYLLLGSIQVVCEANLEMLLEQKSPPHVLKKQQGVSGVLFVGFAKAQLEQLKKPLLYRQHSQGNRSLDWEGEDLS